MITKPGGKKLAGASSAFSCDPVSSPASGFALLAAPLAVPGADEPGEAVQAPRKSEIASRGSSLGMTGAMRNSTSLTRLVRDYDARTPHTRL